MNSAALEPAANSISDIIRRAGFGRSHLYQEINSGRLKARKLGAKTLILEDDFQEFLRSLPAFEPKIGGAA